MHSCLCVCPCSAVGRTNQPRGRSANRSRSETEQRQRSDCTQTDGEIKAGRETQSGAESQRWLSVQADTQTGVTGVRDDRRPDKLLVD